MLQESKWDTAYRTGDYKQYWGLSYPSQELVGFLAATTFPQGSVALDVGCGAGQEAVFLAQQDFRVIGADMSSEGLAIAKAHAQAAGVYIELHQTDITQLDLPAQSVDLINDRGCFHVISDDKRPAVVRKLAQLLKPGGKMLLRGCRQNDHDETHFFPITPEVIAQYFAADFTWQHVLPIQLANGHTGEGLNANLVVLTKK